MFNGYYHVDPNTDDYVAESPPADTSPAEITKYIKGTVPNLPEGYGTTTHDLYWANFVYSAVKLVESGIVRPQPGDILTFMVYMPAYFRRAEIDWAASPYNQVLHINSPWVGGQYPYDSSIRQSDQGADAPPPPPAPANTATTQSPVTQYADSEHRIDHDIFMRTVGDYDDQGRPLPDGGFPKRPHSPAEYTQKIAEIPVRLMLGGRFGDFPPGRPAPPLEKVYIKVLFLANVDDLYEYITDGTWGGNRYRTQYEIYNEDDMSTRLPIGDATWTGGVALKGSPMHPEWGNAPAVDRTKVKIKRLDYFGHSGDDWLYLDWGWGNAKGVVPDPGVIVPKEDMGTHLSPDLFTEDSFAQLWGCNLGAGFAEVVAESVKEVRACRDTTIFENVLNTPNSMPVPKNPSTEPWVIFTQP